MSVDSKMTALADAIRAKTGRTDTLTLDEMTASVQGIEIGVNTSDATATADEIFAGETAYIADGKVTGTFTIENELTEQNELISQISTLVATKANPQGGTDTSDATATAGDILSGKTAYAKGEKITGTIATKTSSNLTASGATVTVPAGYYASNATKSVSSGSAKTPATTVTKNPTISVNSSGLITASVSGTQSVTPTVTAGYVSSGTAGTITVSGSATKQLTTKGATTYTPTTSNQTISSGTYLTGTQTIKGDANLKAENIASGVSIFDVTGTHSGAEDLDTELTTQENLISQLSTILDSKAAGGSGGGAEWVSVKSLPQTYLAEPDNNYITVYYEIPEGCIGVVFTIYNSSLDGHNMGVSYYRYSGDFSDLAIGAGSLTVSDVDGTATILQINYDDSGDIEYYFMPLYEIT